MYTANDLILLCCNFSMKSWLIGVLHQLQMMQNLVLAEGDIIRVRSASLPKGSYVKIQPHTTDFINISNPKAVLETTLRGCASPRTPLCAAASSWQIRQRYCVPLLYGTMPRLRRCRPQHSRASTG